MPRIQPPTGRTVLMLFVLAAAGVLLRTVVLAALFRSAVGFVPFDIQPRLNREMVVIQLGAMPVDRALLPYALFALGDVVVAIVIALFITALWSWMFRKAPNRVFAVVAGGGILIFPAIAALMEIAEHILVFRLIANGNGAALARLADLTVMLHGLKNAFVDARVGLTVAFGLIALIVLWRRRPA